MTGKFVKLDKKIQDKRKLVHLSVFNLILMAYQVTEENSFSHEMRVPKIRRRL